MADNTIHPLLLPIPELDLESTLFCGQSFNWNRVVPGQYYGVAGRRSVFAEYQDGLLKLHRADGAPMEPEDIVFWQHYFAFDLDYLTITDKFRQNKKLAECVAYAPGVRVLRQPFFDTLLSFIISQNNHIPRITSITATLRKEFGTLLAGGGFSCPAPQALAEATLDDLAVLRAGFRAKYLLDAARKVAEGVVDEQAILAMDDAAAREHLMQINGVGPKVADCVLLYSFGRNRIVPMDVWMKRAVQQQFRGKMPAASRGYEGIAQQFIFFWARENLK